MLTIRLIHDDGDAGERGVEESNNSSKGDCRGATKVLLVFCATAISMDTTANVPYGVFNINITDEAESSRGS